VDSHQNLYIVAQTGKCAALAIHAIPVTDDINSGIDVHRAASFAEEDRPIQMFAAGNDRSKSALSVLTISREGLIKKSDLSELPGASSQTFVLTKVNEGDVLCKCLIVADEAEYMVATANGMAIRFAAEEVRSMGLIAAGVNAVKLAPGDLVADMVALKGKGELEFITSDGAGWRIAEEEFPLQKRYGQGVIIGKLKPETSIVGMVYGKKNTQYTLFLHKSVPKLLRIDALPAGKRASVMKTILELKPTDAVTCVLQPSEFVAAPAPNDEKKKAAKDYKQEPIL
jgi:DNA gyrase subunit A